MPHCNNCHVKLRGINEKCPLCGNSIALEVENKQKPVFPEIPPSFERHTAVRILIFISIVATVMSYFVDIIFPTFINRPLYVVFGILSMWLSFTVVVRKRYHLSKNIMWQVTIVSVLSIFWDWQTGWLGWSLDYVIPITCIASLAVMYVTAKVMKLNARDYIAYLLLAGLFGIIPGLFILLKWLKVLFPSVLSVALSIIFLSAILIFQGESIRNELDKRMHL
jgi:hypothetical protein